MLWPYACARLPDYCFFSPYHRRKGLKRVNVFLQKKVHSRFLEKVWVTSSNHFIEGIGMWFPLVFAPEKGPQLQNVKLPNAKHWRTSIGMSEKCIMQNNLSTQSLEHSPADKRCLCL